MKALNPDEIHAAEEALRGHLPKSLKVYGSLLGRHRNKTHVLEVFVDSWPDFKVIICRPSPKKVTFFSTDDQVLKSILLEDNVIDWSMKVLVGGVNTRHEAMLREVSASKGLAMKLHSLVHLMTLTDPNHLPHLELSRDIESRISCLDESHTDLVNMTWKFGGDEEGYRRIKNFIKHFPTCCIVDDKGQPVSWVLLYDYCAMGMLYTLPEHRGKGYAKVLISTMSRRLHSQGCPVYCFIEEDNKLSHRLFRSLGFIEDPTYRAAWFEFSC